MDIFNKICFHFLIVSKCRGRCLSGLRASIINHQFARLPFSIFRSVFLQGHGSKFESRPFRQLIFALPLFFLPSACPQLHALSALCLTLSRSSPSCLQYSVLSPVHGLFFVLLSTSSDGADTARGEGAGEMSVHQPQSDNSSAAV